MRLLIDLQALQGPSAERGIGYYALSLTQALLQDRRGHEVVVLLDAERPPEDVLRLRHALGGAADGDGIALFPSPPVAERVPGAADAELTRQASIAALEPDVVLLTSVFELAALAPMTVRDTDRGVPTAAVLYDLIPLTDLDLYKPDPVLRHDYLQGVSRLAETDLLLSISEHTAAEARRLVQDCPPVTTVHGAAPPATAARRPRWAPSTGFALAVGRDEPRKDIATAVLAWAGLSPQQRGGRAFVVVGDWPEANRQRLTDRAVVAGLPAGDLVFPGPIDDHELAWLYEHAELFAFPSLVEGLGLPPLEAMQVGTPALLARASSLVELVDDPRPYFAPGDVVGLRQLMASVLTDDGLRTELVALGRDATHRFTWARTAALTWDALEALAEPVSTSRASVAVVGPGGQAVAEALAACCDVTVEESACSPGWSATWWRHDLRVYLLPEDGRWEALSEPLADAPGVVLARSGPPPLVDAPLLLAAAIGVLVPDNQTSSALLRAGVVDVPVVVVDLTDGDAVLAALRRCWASDVGGRWAQAAARRPAGADGRSVERRPRWSIARAGRPPLLASDVTAYRTTPFMSGIQRTVARLHHALAASLAAEGGALVPVQLGATPDGVPHPDIRRDEVLDAATVTPQDPDWVLCLDLNAQVAGCVPELLRARARGTGTVVNVFDLIPWTHPQWFPPGAADSSFTPWLHAVVRVGDVLLVNSRATARELERFVQRTPPRRPDGFVVQHLPLGCDFDQAGDVQVTGREGAHFLMVGTVEPRKGHREVLDALEQLWATGSPVRLTVLGRSGWMVDAVVRRMESLALTQPRFAWLQNASDAELDRLYRTCTAAVVASEGEGFGLPVVESALRGCPVVVRDIPVLREVAGDEATYFSRTDPLAAVLARAVAGSPVAQASRASVRTWQEVGDRLLDVLAGRTEPLARWTPEQGWAWT